MQPAEQTEWQLAVSWCSHQSSGILLFLFCKHAWWWEWNTLLTLWLSLYGVLLKISLRMSALVFCQQFISQSVIGNYLLCGIDKVATCLGNKWNWIRILQVNDVVNSIWPVRSVFHHRRIWINAIHIAFMLSMIVSEASLLLKKSGIQKVNKKKCTFPTRI